MLRLLAQARGLPLLQAAPALLDAISVVSSSAGVHSPLLLSRTGDLSAGLRNVPPHALTMRSYAKQPQTTEFMDASLLHSCALQMDVVGISTTVTVSISQTWRTLVEFSLQRESYTFTIDKWRSKSMAGFLVKFHEYQPRDVSEFGSATLSEDGAALLQVTPQQKIATILQAVRDVVSCISQILWKHRRGVLDYAVWYCEKHPEEETYAELITRIACHCIVHSNFMVPNVQWELVQFKSG